MGIVKVEIPEFKVNKVLRLKDLFAPCLMCGGTTDIDWQGHVLCHSCQQKWTLAGDPIIEDDDTIWSQSVGINI